MDKQQQASSLTFFQPDRRVLGVVWVLKRVMAVITLGSILDKNWLIAACFLGLREALSAITDYSSPSNPIVTTQQSSPPNPAEDVATQKTT